MHVAFNIIFQLLLLVKFGIKEPDGAAVPSSGFIQGKMNMRQHIFGFSLRIGGVGRDSHAAVYGQLIIGPVKNCGFFNFTDESLQTLAYDIFLCVFEKKIKTILRITAEKFFRLYMPVGYLSDLPEKLVGFFLSENFSEERKLPYGKCSHASSAGFQRFDKLLPETGHVFRPGKSVMVRQIKKIFIIIAHQPVSIEHQKDYQKYNGGCHKLRHVGGNICARIQTVPCIDTEKIPVIQSYGL